MRLTRSCLGAIDNVALQERVLVHTMISGNPKAGKHLVAIAIALVLVMLGTTALLSMKKRGAPQTKPPLHPSIFVAA